MHVVDLIEYERTHLPRRSLTAAERILVDRLDETGRHLRVEELRSGLEIRATSWVGVVRFETFEVRVQPKLAGGEMRLVEMIELTTGLDTLRRSPGAADIDPTGRYLVDLLALLLVEETDRVLRYGLLSDYLEREETLGVVRGRLLVREQVLTHFGRVDRLECRHDELEQDVDENRLLAVALEVAGRITTHPDVRRRARATAALLREVCNPERIDLRTARPFTYNRLNEQYRDAHTLAWLLIDAYALDDLLRGGSTRSFAFLFDMNRLFERFVEVVVRRASKGTNRTVVAQRKDASVIRNATDGSPYKRVVPDLLVTGRQPPTRLAIDAKYKTYDDRRAATSDVYQTFLYARAYRGDAPTPCALLLHPTARTDAVTTRLAIRPSGGGPADAEVVLHGLHVPSILSDVRGESDGAALERLRRLLLATVDVAPQR